MLVSYDWIYICNVTGACLDMSRLVVAKQKAHRQTDTK